MKRRLNRWHRVLGRTALLIGMLVAASPAQAVIFASTDDPTHNTVEPTGALAGSGWQFHGEWGGFPGITVSPHHFITGRHIGGVVGGTFSFQGTNYTTINVTNNGTDLSVWAVAGEFPVYAPLFHGASEAGQSVVVFGRGTRRGHEVLVNGEVKGWQWGAADGRLRWGENRVAGQYGSLLKFNFDRDAGPNEVHLSSGDSGGGIFVNDGGVWKLTALNYAVDGPWKLTSSGPAFHAALLDRGGLLRGNTTYAESDGDNPSAFYATPIAPSAAWLMTVLALPRPLSPAGFNLSGADSATHDQTLAVKPFVPAGQFPAAEKTGAGAKPAPEIMSLSETRSGR